MYLTFAGGETILLAGEETGLGFKIPGLTQVPGVEGLIPTHSSVGPVGQLQKNYIPL